MLYRYSKDLAPNMLYYNLTLQRPSERLFRRMDSKLLDIICCPVTPQPLEYLDQARLGQLNQAIRDDKALNSADQVVSEEFSEALVTRDARLVYPIRNGVPILLEEESIDWARLPG